MSSATEMSGVTPSYGVIALPSAHDTLNDDHRKLPGRPDVNCAHQGCAGLPEAAVSCMRGTIQLPVRSRSKETPPHPVGTEAAFGVPEGSWFRLKPTSAKPRSAGSGSPFAKP